MTNENKSWFVGICGIILMLWLIWFVAIPYFQNVNFGQWLYHNNYIEDGVYNKGEHYKQIGLFLGSMAGIYFVFQFVGSLLSYLPNLKGGKNGRKRN